MTENHIRILERDGRYHGWRQSAQTLQIHYKTIETAVVELTAVIICVGSRDVIHVTYSCVLISVDQTIHWDSSECFPTRWDPSPSSPPTHRNIPWVCLSRYPLLDEMKHICCPRKWNTWKSTVRPRAVCSVESVVPATARRGPIYHVALFRIGG